MPRPLFLGGGFRAGKSLRRQYALELDDRGPDLREPPDPNEVARLLYGEHEQPIRSRDVSSRRTSCRAGRVPRD